MRKGIDPALEVETMANYITTLRAENAAQKAEIASLQAGMRDLLAHLQSPKFHGAENAWISTNDVAIRIREIEYNATIAGESV